MDDHCTRKSELKEAFTRQRGYWSELWSGLLDRDPDFFEAYMNFSSAPWLRKGLDPKVRELIYVAIDASTTHLYEMGTRIHMANALKYGATSSDILEVLELTSVLGLHSCTVGVPILMEELSAAGKNDVSNRALTPEEEALKADFVSAFGYWDETQENMLHLSPDYFKASTQFVSVPWKRGSLEPKIKNLIHVAICAATTHLHEPGIRLGIRNALQHGATASEIMEVFELVSVLGIHTIASSMPILDEVIATENQRSEVKT